jgi:ribosomal-protein-alanine N-acetyltransferase
MNLDLVAGLPMLEGERIRLRPLGSADSAALHAVFSDARVMAHWSHAPLRTMDDIAWYLRDIEAGGRHGTHYQWGIALRAQDATIGTLTLFAFDRQRRRAEVGYALARAYWGLGYAGEALRVALPFAFGALRLDTIEARVDPANVASLRLLVAAGFHDDGDGAVSPAGAEHGPRRCLSINKNNYIFNN